MRVLAGGPSSADWLAASAAVLGAVGTSGALAFIAVTFRRENTDRRRHQADRISAWIFQPPTSRTCSVKVLNTSGRAVWQCFGTVLKRDTNREVGHFHERVLPPIDEPWTPFVGVLAGKAAEYVIELEFFDQAGQHWHRNGAGKLTLLNRPRSRIRRRLSRLMRAR